MLGVTPQYTVQYGAGFIKSRQIAKYHGNVAHHREPFGIDRGRSLQVAQCSRKIAALPTDLSETGQGIDIGGIRFADGQVDGARLI